MDVGKRLRDLREEKSLTVNRLANIAGLSQSFLRDIELGNKNPTVETVSLLCDALGLSLAEFFNTEQTEINPALMTSIKKLNSEQQSRLADFLKSIKS